MVDGCANLRLFLRESTAQAHDRLDWAIRAGSGWTNERDYARFLALQFAARKPVEAWLAKHAPDELIPPIQTPLIAQDLAALGAAAPDAQQVFEPGIACDAYALGMAWALAGSSLGNRSILKDVRRASGDAIWPTAFLADEAMFAFWQVLRPRIEAPANHDIADAARNGATALFEHFLTSTGARTAPVAAPQPAQKVVVA